jgi:hypothetical protein
MAPACHSVFTSREALSPNPQNEGDFAGIVRPAKITILPGRKLGCPKNVGNLPDSCSIAQSQSPGDLDVALSDESLRRVVKCARHCTPWITNGHPST